MTYYVINLSQKHTAHEGTEDSCRAYISNVVWMNVGLNRSDFIVVNGAKNRDSALKNLRSINHPSRHF